MAVHAVLSALSVPGTLPSEEDTVTLLRVPLLALTATAVSTGTAWALAMLVFTLTAGTSGVAASVDSVEVSPEDTILSASQALRTAAASPRDSAPATARLTRGVRTDVRKRPLDMRNSPWKDVSANASSVTAGPESTDLPRRVHPHVSHPPHECQWACSPR